MDKEKCVAIDFGAGDKMRIHGAHGPIPLKDLKLPRVKGGKTPEDDFLRVLRHFLAKGFTVVAESPTVGSCGAEPKKVRDLMLSYPQTRFLLISSRAVKNYLLDNNIEKATTNADAQSAEILWHIATTQPKRLRVWRYEEHKYQRKETSVRPRDKNKYRDEDSKKLLASIPTLPPEIEKYLRTPADKIPFIMALSEPLSTSRNGYQKVIGLYEHGYPSFYRRATVDLMQDVAKKLAGVGTMREVTRETRKEAWKQVQRLLRRFYSICKRDRRRELDTMHSAKDTKDSTPDTYSNVTGVAA